MPRKRKEEVTIEPGKGLNLDPELIKQLVPGTLDRAASEDHQGARPLPVGRGRAQTDLAGAAQRRCQVDRLPARLEECHDSVRTALPGTIQHWSLNLNPPHTRNSGYPRCALLKGSNRSLFYFPEIPIAGHHFSALYKSKLRICRSMNFVIKFSHLNVPRPRQALHASIS
ncbi:transposase, putative [Burkholderia thailandensis E264]|uniref:Transposase, putative n=1 Tax=Burkholderia thailandensis (strain ATCC 700388 / DSM 13276 / CCUG 48851 / CIP 106301 / E264) TaxID=271848 RepID=Q2T2L4_BURTA|nr:transposase, putative [Burkholderia thailandensis E264]